MVVREAMVRYKEEETRTVTRELSRWPLFEGVYLCTLDLSTLESLNFVYPTPSSLQFTGGPLFVPLDQSPICRSCDQPHERG